MNWFLWILSGADPVIIAQCDALTRFRFKRVGWWVFFIAVISFASMTYTLYEVFKDWTFAVIFGMFFTWLFMNIYAVLLSTLSKNMLPHPKSPNGQLFSLILRVSFLALMALIISKPIGALLLDIFSEKKFIVIDNKVFEYKFIARIKDVGTSTFGWALSIIIIAIFQLPAYFKYSIEIKNKYYILKVRIEKMIIEEEYKLFKDNYTARMYTQTGEAISFKENYKNPPYNTKPLNTFRKVKTQEQFLQEIYNPNNWKA